MTGPAATPRYVTRRPSDLRRPNPRHRLGHIISALPRALRELAGELHVPAGGTVLDLGCADVPYRDFFAANVRYLAADLPGNPHANLEISADGEVPVPDDSVDAVLSTQVLEHAADPRRYLEECFRVLRPGGRMLLSTHGLMVWHPDPVDLWRWTSEGLREQVERAGFAVLRLEGVMGLTASGLQLLQDGILGRVPRRARTAVVVIFQRLIGLAERHEAPGDRRLNALVFALVAEKPRPLAIARIIESFAASHPEATFVEVGANDGQQHDHLRPYIEQGGWRGVMVEPVPYVFERLRRNYAEVPGVELVNAAIAESSGRRRFFGVRDADPRERAGLPDWYDGIGSFRREAVLSHVRQIPDIADRIVEHDVEALSLRDLLQRHGLQRPDLIVLDAEGHDGAILRSLDLALDGPRLLVYEHFHMAAEERAQCHASLRAAGYETLEEGFDTIALRPAEDELTRTFRALEPGVAALAKDEEGGP